MAPVEERHQLAAGQLGQRRDRFQVGVGPFEQPVGEDGQRRPQAPDPPRSPDPTGGRDGVQSLPERDLRLDLAGEAQVDGDVAGDRDDDLAGRHLLGGRHAGEQHRMAHGVAQRRDPEVVLQLGQRLRERLGHGARPVDRAAGHAADHGRDRAGLEQPELVVGGDGPLDVLRPAEGAGDLAGEVDEAPQVGGGQLRPVVAVVLDHPGAGVEQVAGAVDLAADERLGTALDR
jgi:hypothetical protein